MTTDTLQRIRELLDAARAALVPESGLSADLPLVRTCVADALALAGGEPVAASLDMEAATAVAAELGWEVDPDGDGNGIAELTKIISAATGVAA